jgi:hypothetical protein
MLIFSHVNARLFAIRREELRARGKPDVLPTLHKLRTKGTSKLPKREGL